MPGLGGVVAGLINEETNPSIRIACGLVPVGGDKMHLISANMPSKAVRPYQDALVLASVPGGKVDTSCGTLRDFDRARESSGSRRSGGGFNQWGRHSTERWVVGSGDAGSRRGGGWSNQ